MINFLAPSALFGLALLAIPLAIHLFRPRKVRHTPFSSLRWLFQTEQRLARRIKWHQLLLLLIRAAFVTAIVLALARPQYYGSGKAEVVERFIVLDTSRSMAYRTADQQTPLETGREFVSELLMRSRAGDRTAVLLTNSRTQILTSLTDDLEGALPAVEQAATGIAGTDLNTALATVQAMLPQCREEAGIELYFVTDNHQQSWSPAGVQAFVTAAKRPVQVQIVQVGVMSPRNAWIADAQVRPGKAAGQTIVAVDLACSGEGDQRRQLHIGGSSEPVDLKPGGSRRVTFSIPAIADPQKEIMEIRLEPPDSLPEDDVMHVDLSSGGGLRVLLVEQATSRVPSLRPGFHLNVAMEALSRRRRNISVTMKSPGELIPADILDAEVIILADVASLTDATLSALEARVKAGAGLAVFLGPSVKREFYNNGMHDPLHPQDSLFPLPLASATEPADGRPVSLKNIDWTHALFAGLLDPKLGDIAVAQVRRFYRFDDAAISASQLLAWIEDDVPAVIEHALGPGRVLIFNMTANDTWSDLPRRNSFIPLIDRMLTFLGGTRTRQFTADETVAVVLPGVHEEEAIVVEGPDGTPVQATVNTVGGRTFVRLDNVSQAGVFRIIPGGDTSRAVPLIIRPGVADSVPTPIDTELLGSWWAPADFTVVNAASELEQLSKTTHLALSPWLICLACLLLLTEMYLVHRLCPRLNPAVTTMLVSHQSSETVQHTLNHSS
ncbi:MAG: BatA and WFA domain-containing protein [Lentisphaeria bacterium]|jgi:hypothetical protein|nr:BatA and WFA domain-containing protein [Lentisphaeria bacterium]MDP7742017.1 BatA and WFA domain-containing protein [Lentisphaeria bacterium]